MLTHPTPKRAAAAWIAGTGAFLLLAAAFLFVAVRWQQLPDGTKLAVIGLLTGAFLAGGRWLRPSFPATGDALFHLGAFLLPVDLAAVNLRLGMGWRGLLLAEGLLVAAAFAWIAAWSRSTVLAWASVAGVVLTAAGVAGLSALPAPLLLAVAGAGAHVAAFATAARRATAFATHARRAAVSWSVVAGLAPLLGVAITVVLAAAGTQVGGGVLAELGLAGRSQSLMALAASALVAVVLTREATIRQDMGLAAIAGVSMASGSAITWIATEPSAELTLTALAAVFLLSEVTALLLRRDPFWSRPARWLAAAIEVTAATVGSALAAVGFLGLVYVFLVGPGETSLAHMTAAVSLTLVALAWLVAALRRLPARSPSWSVAAEVLGHPLGVLAVASAVSVVPLATGSAAATSVAFVVTAALLFAAGSEAAQGLATLLAVGAPTLAWRWPALATTVAAAGALVLATGAVLGSRQRDGRGDVFASHVLAALACGCAAQAAFFLNREVDDGLALTVAVASVWALAPLLDRGRPSLGDVARLAAVVPVLAALPLGPAQALTVAAVAALAYTVETLRLDRPSVGLGAGAALQLVVIHGCRWAGLEPAQAGLVLCVGAVVSSGLATLAPGRWRLPLLGAAVLGMVTGLALATVDPRMLATALMVCGGLGIGAGVVTGDGRLGHGGGALVVLGISAHLAQSDVGALEPYAAPVAAHLVVAGWHVRRRHLGTSAEISSWLAYGPSVALLGGSAFAERLAGGAGWHALLAGAVGVAAVAIGGWRRLAGPLMLGTGLVSAVTVVESLPAMAGVPTWGWLATGGAFLVLVGLALERSETSPVVAGRRLVDVIGERFD